MHASWKIFSVLTLGVLALSCRSANDLPPLSWAGASVVVVDVALDQNRKIVPRPEPAYAVAEMQEVEWQSCEGRVKVEFKNAGAPPNPDCTIKENGREKCKSKPFKKSEIGTHPYNIWLYDAHGNLIAQVDPEIIVVGKQ